MPTKAVADRVGNILDSVGNIIDSVGNRFLRQQNRLALAFMKIYKRMDRVIPC